MTISLESLHPTSRFSNRVENYVKYRPSYPDTIITFLEETAGLTKTSLIADIGCGTGLFSEKLLQAHYRVIGIEPNEEMRKAAQYKLSGYTDFICKNGCAEKTGLDAGSIDLITVAQAFHWMAPHATKKEFFRILKPGGIVVLAWNVRNKHTPFLKAYDDLQRRFSIERKPSRIVNDHSIRAFYEPRKVYTKKFPNIQELNFESLKGQLLSSSFMPLLGHARYDTMIDQLANIFVRHNARGYVRMEYNTELFWNF